MENRSRKRVTLLVIVLLIAIGIGTIVYLALWNNKKNDIAVGNTGTIISRLRALQVTGGKLEISEGELNGMLKTFFNKPVARAGVVVNDVYSDINNGRITFYAPVRYKNINLLPNITGTVRYENEKVIFNISSVKVGKLGIPKSILLEQLRNFSNKDINVTENSIEISKYLLPFNAKNVYLEGDKLIAEIDKLNILKESSNKNTDNSKSKSDTAASPGVKAAQAETLAKVSSQLNDVIASVSTPKEKQMMKKIQTVVNRVSEDPTYQYQKDVNEVKAWYSTLQPGEKDRVKSAVLKNVNPLEILKLINIFGGMLHHFK